MSCIFRDLLQEGVVVNYMDDFAIPADNEEQLAERTIRFLERAAQYNLCFKRTKCLFNVQEIPMLGVRVGDGKVQMEEEKVAAV